MKHTIQAEVENKFGVLARVASLFSARGYNIESLAVGETQDPTISSMTIVVNAPDERVLEQIKKQLNKLIDVITVVDFTQKESVSRDLILAKVSSKAETLGLLEKFVSDYPVRVVDKQKDCWLLEVCVDHRTEEELITALKAIGLKELVRTGRIALGK
jgi:acetolactate synthase-1/3 small subunit